MSKTAKSKLKWRYYTGEIHNRHVYPDKFKRLHAPLNNILQWRPEFQGKCVTLRPCEEGVDEDGAVKAVLYCTENCNRFFDQDKDGFWNEQKPDYSPNRPSKKIGGVRQERHANGYTFYTPNYGTMSYFDLDKMDWRSFKLPYLNNIESYSTLNTINLSDD